MRTMLKLTIPVEQGNKVIKDGSIGNILKSLQEELKPEAAYFYTQHGQRTAQFVFDMNSPSQIPALAEPLFIGLNASVDFFPVMNADDLQTGLEQWAKRSEPVPAGR